MVNIKRFAAAVKSRPCAPNLFGQTYHWREKSKAELLCANFGYTGGTWERRKGVTESS